MFEYPKRLKEYLNKKSELPFSSYLNNSTYYANVAYPFVNYMQFVVRPCIAYATGTADLGVNARLSAATGKAIVDGATRLSVGDKVFFEGADLTREFFSDVWQYRTNFRAFLMKAEHNKYTGGCSICKINTDQRGRNTLSTVRIDRALPTFDDAGEVIGCTFYLSLLSDMRGNTGEHTDYWLLEQRSYDKDDRKTILYKVCVKSGVANSPVLPSPTLPGVAYANLPGAVKRQIDALGIRLNAPMDLPYRDGLGVWALNTAGANTVIPDLPFGAPLLAGAQDLLWAIDLAFSGSVVDVLNGEGKVIVPKQFLQQTLRALAAATPGQPYNITTAELDGYGAENFVYIQPSGIDKEKTVPTPVQFEIRSEAYRGMWEMFQREACVRAGFSPTSIFPHLSPDNSAKTAREVTAEENLTRASVEQAHLMDIPVFNRMLREVAFMEDLPDDIEIKLSDYIGNKLERDANIRDNFAAGLIPREIAVQQVNNLSAAETRDYLDKIDADDKRRTEQARASMSFSDEIPGTEGMNDYNSETAEPAGAYAGASPAGDPEGGV